MPRIGKPRPQHPFVAGDDHRAAVLGLDIGDEAEPRRRRTGGIAQREIALVDPHRHLHHFRRQIHERRIDLPEQRHRPFHQSGHLVEQPGILDHRQTAGRRLRRDAVRDAGPPLGGIDQHAMACQPVRPVGRRGHGEGARSVEPVALGQIARGQAMPVVLPLGKSVGDHRRHPAGKRCGAAGEPR